MPLDHVERLEQADALLEGEVGCVGTGVGERAGLDDRAQEARDSPVVAAQLEDLLDDRAVLADELRGLDGRHRLVRPLLGVGAQAPSVSVLRQRRSRRDACRAASRRAAAGQANALADGGDRAHGGILAVVARARAAPRSPRRRRRRGVTVMLGKTTASSSGISNSSVTWFLLVVGAKRIANEPPRPDRSRTCSRRVAASLRTSAPRALYRYPALDELLGAEVHVKHENHQPIGAFKVRGGVNLVSQLSPEERERGVITASTGNHGQSIAYALGSSASGDDLRARGRERGEGRLDARARRRRSSSTGATSTTRASTASGSPPSTATATCTAATSRC
jgi:hypothetical protein